MALLEFSTLPNGRGFRHSRAFRRRVVDGNVSAGDTPGREPYWQGAGQSSPGRQKFHTTWARV